MLRNLIKRVCNSRQFSTITSPGIYGWGSTEYGQLGQGNKIEHIEQFESLQFSTMNFSPSEYKIVTSMEKNSLFLIQKDGKEFFYTVGNGGGSAGFECDEPIYLPFHLKDIDCESIFNSPIKKIEPGRFHVLITTG